MTKLYNSIKIVTIIATSCLLVTQDALAESYIEIRARCNENNLSPDEATLRNKWAKKCFPAATNDINAADAATPRKYVLAVNRTNGSYVAPLNLTDACDGWDFIATCVASCFPAGERILFSDGYWDIEKALKARHDGLVTLESNSFIDNLLLKVSRVNSYTQSIKEGNEKIITFKTESGGILRVTEGHPILVSTGTIKKASQIRAGEELLIGDMGPIAPSDRIIKIEISPYFGKVFNIAPESANPLENIIIANGFLVGSANFQYNEMFQSLWNKKLLRSLIKLPSDEEQTSSMENKK